jgi:D-galacturonate reductase
MRYTPDERGRFVGQLGYGYRSIQDFMGAAVEVVAGVSKAGDWDDRLATAATTLQGTAILEAGRKSLDSEGRSVKIVYEGDSMEPLRIE